MISTSKPTSFSTLAPTQTRMRPWMHTLLTVAWGVAAGAWAMLEIVYGPIQSLISHYSDVQMIVGVYNLYDHLFLYRIGLGGATLVLLPVLLWSIVKRPS